MHRQSSGATVTSTPAHSSNPSAEYTTLFEASSEQHEHHHQHDEHDPDDAHEHHDHLPRPSHAIPLHGAAAVVSLTTAVSAEGGATHGEVSAERVNR